MKGKGYFIKCVQVFSGEINLKKTLNEVNEQNFPIYGGNGNNKCKYIEFRKQCEKHQETDRCEIMKDPLVPIVRFP